jgi:hypothetical protein
LENETKIKPGIKSQNKSVFQRGSEKGQFLKAILKPRFKNRFEKPVQNGPINS